MCTSLKFNIKLFLIIIQSYTLCDDDAAAAAAAAAATAAAAFSARSKLSNTK
jgi:hypothetical protein